MPDAPPELVKAAYRILARFYHPDMGPAKERAQRTKQMTVINGAYERLTK